MNISVRILHNTIESCKQKLYFKNNLNIIDFLSEHLKRIIAKKL